MKPGDNLSCNVLTHNAPVQALENVQGLQATQKQILKERKQLHKLIAQRPLPPLASFDPCADSPALHLHQLEGSEATNEMIKLRTQWLIKSEPTAAHIVMSPQLGQVVCALGHSCKSGSAVDILKQALSDLNFTSHQTTKCGGSVKFAQGKLGEHTPQKFVSWAHERWT